MARKAGTHVKPLVAHLDVASAQADEFVPVQDVADLEEMLKERDACGVR